LAAVYGVLSLLFGLLFLFDCVRFRKEINSYVKCGILCGLIFIAFDMAALALTPNILSGMPIYLLATHSFVAFVKVTVFTCMGMYCCAVIRIDAFSTARLLRKTDNDSLMPGAFLVSVATTVALAVGYSVVLFRLTSPQMSALLREVSAEQTASLGISDRPSFLMALALIEFAFAEEIIFRLGIQNYLARQFKLQGGRYWIAIILTTLFWSIAHANTLQPEWVKIAQVFPFGLALGFLFRKYGTETCILVHGIFNLVMMFLAPYLINGH